MRVLRFVPFVIIIFLCSKPCSAQIEGFYKDLFMDGGVDLTSRTTLPSADALNLSMEFLATSDITLQDQLIINSPIDQNGRLLYPDGAPRFALIYTNGGSATNHGNSMGEEGRNRIRDFYYNGGSYSGSCAGAFIGSLSYMSSGVYEPYYHIWPGRTEPTGLLDTYTGHFIPDDSPLLNYYNFGGDLYINNVYHNGGCTVRENINFPAGTEVLLKYDYPAKSMHERPSCWAYKDDEQTGRIVVIGSHPEGVTSGERLDLMKAILLYALDGFGEPQAKATLINGQTRIMDKVTSGNDPAYTKIGDKQYHHFAVEIPEGAKNLSVILSGNDEHDFNLYLNKDYFAFDGASEYFVKNVGANKSIELEDILPGTWYVGVKCETTVQSSLTGWGYSYSGNLEVLDGVEYSIAASWDTTATGFTYSAEIPNQFTLLQNYPNPFNSKTVIAYELFKGSNVNLFIFNDLGQKVATLVSKFQPAGKYQISWDASEFPSGVYLARLGSDNNYSQTIKLILVK